MRRSRKVGRRRKWREGRGGRKTGRTTTTLIYQVSSVLWTLAYKFSNFLMSRVILTAP